MTSLLNTGIYAVPEAARLTHVSPWRIRRWLRGYEFRTSGGRHRSPAVWQGQIPPIGTKVALGFLDLLETRCVDAFISAGVSWTFLRRAHFRARELIGHGHPFCTNRFATDGRTIFFETREHTDEVCLWDIADLQRVFEQVIRPFIRELDYDEETIPSRWWPRGREHQVALDPGRCFGQPIISSVGVPTRVLADSLAANGSAEEVARWFEVPLATVYEAAEFEKSLVA